MFDVLLVIFLAGSVALLSIIPAIYIHRYLQLRKIRKLCKQLQKILN